MAMLASAALSLWLGRGTIFSVDELDWFSTTPDLDLRGVLQPYTGHLILVSRIVYAAFLDLFGAAYLPFRALTTSAVLLVAGLFFVFAKRRVGALVALAPTVVLLFYGAAAEDLVTGNGFTELIAVAAGLGALLALERADRAGDIGACALLGLAVVSYSEAIPFLAGAAALILLGPDRARRLWVFLLPAAGYAAWFAWSASLPASAEANVRPAGVLEAPAWAFESLGVAAAAVTGLGYDFGDTGLLGLDTTWGPVVAALALIALGVRLWRGGISRWLLATLSVPLTLWLIHSLASGVGRTPANPRYLFTITVAILLVAAEAARGVKLGRSAIVAVYAVAAISVATNIALLRDGAADFRGLSDNRRATLTAVELGGEVGPGVVDSLVGPVMQETGQGNVATGYLEAARRFGSPALSVEELRSQPDGVRARADAALAANLELALEPVAGPARGCRRVEGTRGTGTEVELPRGGAVLRASEGPVPVRLRRFADSLEPEVGELEVATPSELAIPPDGEADPWHAWTPASELEVCER